MKILELRFKNLNSLYGEWRIDFTDPEYVTGGIFALTGATGAGKSTILDAICLALYGATARLGKITKKQNEIMSRQTGECYAEVVFASEAGQFRCHWEQRRARKKPTGRLQDQEHQIVDDLTGKPIETKKSLVAAAIEQRTGMDFDRFTRSILLAQGGFDTFLKADVEQKSKILEQITGTAIYSEISRRVHERQREEREKLNILNAETSGIVTLDAEQEREIREAFAAKKKQETVLAEKLTKTSQAITWLSSIADLHKEIASFTDERAKLRVENEAFEPQRVRLDQAVKAAALDGQYATLVALRKQQTNDERSLATAEAKLPELVSSAKRQAAILDDAEKLVITARKELKTAAPLLQKIRLLDQNIAALNRAVAEAADSCAKNAVKIKTDEQLRLKEQQERATAEKTLDTVEQYLKENAGDEWLLGGLAGIEEQFAALLHNQQEVERKEADLKKADIAATEAARKLEQSAKDCSQKKRHVEAACKELQRAKDLFLELLNGKSLREYRAEKDALLREMALIQRIEELEEQRKRLQDGKPCPLCGATEHPFAQGNIPVPDELERRINSLVSLIEKADTQEATNKKLEQAEILARNLYLESEKLQAMANNEVKTAERIRGELKRVLTELCGTCQKQQQAIADKLQSLHYSVDITEPKLALLSLKSKMQKWQQQFREKGEIEKQLTIHDAEITRLNAVIATETKGLKEKQQHLHTVKKELAAITGQRHQEYGEKDPDGEEQRLNRMIADAEEAEKKAREQHTLWQQRLTTANTHHASSKKTIEQRVPELRALAADFARTSGDEGFQNEQAFCAARMSRQERESLAARAKALDDATTELVAKQKDRERRLAMERAKQLTEKSLDELVAEHKECEDALQELRDGIASLNYQLGENVAAKERLKDKEEKISAQKKEWQRWERLHNLIGSADGKKYRNFAQGLTFELMVTQANRQLAKMTDRYLLIRDDQSPLDLNVIDQYQAGEIRSVKNLSGGESFIVSLTLALGLSQMASRKVRVDSLFLDEGFGTLDDDALETALETLAGLQQDGKLIGVISHVSALKERIRTQIEIVPGSGGRSRLSGPGCSMVKKTSVS